MFVVLMDASGSFCSLEHPNSTLPKTDGRIDRDSGRLATEYPCGSASVSYVTPLLAAVLYTGVLMSGCGDGTSPSPTTPTPPTPSQPPASTEGPAVPSGLHVSASGTDFIEWSWTPVEGAEGYDVQFSFDEVFTDSDEIAARTGGETSYRRQPLTAGSGASLRVRSAVGVGGDRVTSAWSTHVTGMAAAVPQPAALVEEICTDWAELTVGDYLFLNNVWNKGDITDYEQCLMRRVVDGGDEFGWRWRWPYGRGEAKAYPQVIYGQTPWRSATTTDLPRQISSVENLRVEYELDVAKDGDIRVVFALWVTSTDPPTPESITHDIRIRVDRMGSPSSSDAQINIGGVLFALSVDPPRSSDPDNRTRIRLESHTSALDGRLEIHELLGYLVERGHVPVDHYLAAVEMGTELISGSGELWIRSYDINVDTAPPGEPPVAPSGLHVSGRDEDFIEWSWDAVPGVDGYQVEFSTDASSNDAELGSTRMPMYRKTGLDAGMAGYLRVRSVAGAGVGQLVSAWTMYVAGRAALLPPPNDTTPPPMDPTPAPPVEQACGDWDELWIGDYFYLNNVWNKGTTRDYEQCVMRRVVDGRDEYGWRWLWPAPSDRVRAYPEVRFGWPPYHSFPSTSKLPRRIASLRELQVNYEAYMTAVGVYNMAFSMWLTTGSPPSPQDITTEIMIWTDRNWDSETGSLESRSLVDHVEIDGSTFAVYLRPEHVSGNKVHVFVAFLSHVDQFRGTLDLKKFLDYLVDRDVISADDYVSVVELGNEVKHGTGNLWLKEFEVNVR